MADTYRVVITGAREGFADDAMIERLAPLFKMPAEKVRRRFLSGSFTVKKAVDHATAEKYRAFLEQNGCACMVEPEAAEAAAAPVPAPSAPAPSVAASAPAPMPAPAPEISAPAPAARAIPACAQCGAQGFLIGALCERCAALAMKDAAIDVTGSLPRPAARQAMAALAATEPPIDITSKLPALKPATANAPDAALATMAGASIMRPRPAAAPKLPPVIHKAMEPRGFVGHFDPRKPVHKGAKKHHALRGKGELIFTSAGLHIRGKRPRPFWFDATEHLTIAYDAILDAVAEGKRVHFNVHGLAPEPRRLCFAVASADEAQEILALLPASEG